MVPFLYQQLTLVVENIDGKRPVQPRRMPVRGKLLGQAALIILAVNKYYVFHG